MAGFDASLSAGFANQPIVLHQFSFVHQILAMSSAIFMLLKMEETGQLDLAKGARDKEGSLDLWRAANQRLRTLEEENILERCIGDNNSFNSIYLHMCLTDEKLTEHLWHL